MDKKIPFGKFKGKHYNFLLNDEHKDYVIWLLEECTKTLAFHPEFHQFLKEEFVDDYIKKNDVFNVRKPSKHDEMDGVLISTFVEYRNLITKVYSDVWKNSSKENVYKTFGEPESYPFTAIFFQNNLNAFDGKELCKIYVKEKPSIRYYSKSIY